MAKPATETDVDFVLDEDTVHGLEGGEYAPAYERPVMAGGSVRVNKAVIAIVAGSMFLIAALAALVISLQCLWGGVFGGVAADKAIAGFFGGVLVALVAGMFGWRFIARA